MRVGVKAGLIVLAAAVAGMAACATTLKTKVGWDEHADFSKYHTWAWKPDGSIEDPVWARRCQDVLSDQLATDPNIYGHPDITGGVTLRF